MTLIAIESTAKGFRWTPDGHEVSFAPTPSAVLERLHEPSAIVCEPAFFDGLRDVRRYLEELLTEHGHTLVPMTAGARTVLERARGSSIRGRGVARLHALATSGSERPDPKPSPPRAARVAGSSAAKGPVAASARVAACSGSPKRSAASATSRAPRTSHRSAVPRARRSRPSELAAYRAASVSTSRDLYERLLGLNAGAHGALTRAIRGWYVARNTTAAFERDSVMTWSDYRRALRAIFHRVKAAQIEAAAA
jgi:hypothetical protein